MAIRKLGFLLAATSLALIIGCTSYDSRLTSPATVYLGAGHVAVTKGAAENLAEAKSYWDGNGLPGNPSIVINLTEQTASFYKGNKLVGVSAISSGREGYDTPTGNYKIIQKSKDHVSNLYGDFVDATGNVVVRNVGIKDPKPPGTVFKGSPMPYFMRIVDGVGMHAGFLPGVPDSHGCIRMPRKMAEIYFNNVSKGTPVTITR